MLNIFHVLKREQVRIGDAESAHKVAPPAPEAAALLCAPRPPASPREVAAARMQRTKSWERFIKFDWPWVA